MNLQHLQHHQQQQQQPQWKQTKSNEMNRNAVPTVLRYDIKSFTFDFDWMETKQYINSPWILSPPTEWINAD